MLEILKRIIRQNTVAVGQPVLNIHGRGAGTATGATTSASVTWTRLLVPGTELVSIEEFYQRYNIQDTHPFDLISAPGGVLNVREPGVMIQLFRGVVSLDHTATFTLDVAAGGTGASVALYVNGVLDRTRPGSLSVVRMLDAGTYMLEIMVVGSDVTIQTPGEIEIDGLAETVPTPTWVGLSTNYLDTQTGGTAVTLRWLADNRSGGWKIYRRELITLGAITAVAGVEAGGEVALSLAGNWESYLARGNDFLCGTQVVGTVLVAQYSPTAGNTSVRLLLKADITSPAAGWVNRTAYTGVNIEITKITRTVSSGIVVWNDTTVAFRGAYAYTLQAYGSFDESLLSALSETRYMVAGDAVAPGSIVIQNKGVPTTGYPQVRDKVARVKYRTPTDSDYYGVRVVFRTQYTGTVNSSGSGVATLNFTGSSPAISASAVVGYTIKFTNGAGQNLERTILTNTTSNFTFDRPFDTTNFPTTSNTFTVYKDTTLTIDFGAPNTDDELMFTTTGYGTYYFRAFDLAGNEQTNTACESWTYASSDDVATVTNVAPIVSLTQLDDTTQSTFFAGGDARNNPLQYAIVLLSAFDPVDGTTGVTLFYQIVGSAQTSMPASTAATTGAVDVPAGTRNRYVLLDRGARTTQIVFWATDAQALDSGRDTFTVDFNLTPEIVNVESRDVGSQFEFTVNVDDDCRGIKYWMEPANDVGDFAIGSPAQIDTSVTKTVVFASVVPDGSLKVIKVVPYPGFAGGVVTGSPGDTWQKEVSRTPRTTVTFESRDSSGNLSGTTVRSNVIVTPVRNAIASRTASASGNTTTVLTDSVSPAWTVDQYGFSDTSRRYYFVEITSGVNVGLVRKITSNTASTLTFTPPLPAAATSATYKIWNAATVVYTDGFIAGTQTPVGELFLVGATMFFDRRGDATNTFQFASYLTGATPERLHTMTIDKDTMASLSGFTVNESPAGTLTISCATFDDDTKYWRVYARRGGLPTISGAALTRSSTTKRLNLDDTYLRFEDTPSVASFTMTASTGSWSLIAVPYNSYNEDGDPLSWNGQVSGPSASPAITSLAVTPVGNTENDISWTNLNVPAGYLVEVKAQLDSGSVTTLGTVAATAGVYAHTGIGTRAASNDAGVWKTYTYTLQLKTAGSVNSGAAMTIQRQDYFVSTSGTASISTATAAIYSNGSGDPAGFGNRYYCDTPHINRIAWTLANVADTEWIININVSINSGTFFLVAQVNPSVGEYLHSESTIFSDGTGAARTYAYQVVLVVRSTGSAFATSSPTLISTNYKNCIVP